MVKLSCFTLLALALPVWSREVTKPHIVFILTDDMGFNDFSFHGSNQIPTPNVDALAVNGIILNQLYAQPLCTPSRAALMTGLYPIRTGFQGDPIIPSENRSLPLGKILPGSLKDLGYKTHMVGKWHLGHAQEKDTPTRRGFDSFFGYLTGYISFYDHEGEDNYPKNVYVSGHDFRRNTAPARDLQGRYATHLFTEEAINIIGGHDQTGPLFLYLAHLAGHASHVGEELEKPPGGDTEYLHINEPQRRTYAAMIGELDKSIGRVVEALDKKNMLNNTIIVVMSDNGAPTFGFFGNRGSNYPFRGIKAHVWEGSVRAAGLVWSPLLSNTPRVSQDLFHISDWFPTLLAAAGSDLNSLPLLDGVNQWPMLTSNEQKLRTNLLINIDEVTDISAIRWDEGGHAWKVVQGSKANGTQDGFYGEGTNEFPEQNPPYNITAVTSTSVYTALYRLASQGNIPYPSEDATIQRMREEATNRCPNGPENPCNPLEAPCLFDLVFDPCEKNNIASAYPEKVAELLFELGGYRSQLLPQILIPYQPELANPAFFNGSWTPWIDDAGVPLAYGDKVPERNKVLATAYEAMWKKALGIPLDQSMYSTLAANSNQC